MPKENIQMIKFGPAGNSDLFYETGGKSSQEVPEWLSGLGLSAYEYQCGRGVRIGEDTASKIGIAAKKHHISVSVHGPYYINLASVDTEARRKSINHILKALRAASWLGASPVVFHSGGVGDMPRTEALNIAKNTLEEALNQIEKEGLSHIKLAPETMGKQNQLGNLEEVLELCKVSPQHLIPAVDFAHLHAVNNGSLTEKGRFEEIVEQVEGSLGKNAIKNLHIHFSPIEFGLKGEKRHKNLADKGFGPDFKLLAEVIIENNMAPTIICESAGKQVEDALMFQRLYNDLLSTK